MGGRTTPLLALALLALATTASAQTQTVTYAVNAINTMAVSGDPGALTITTATPGSPPTSVTDATTTWHFTTNQTGAKVQAALATNMPAGVTLTVDLQAPTAATSAGAVVLTTVATDLVTGITLLNESGKTITYSLSATAAAGVVSGSKVVTYTVVAGT